jgi:hypothetical protein
MSGKTILLPGRFGKSYSRSVYSRIIDEYISLCSGQWPLNPVPGKFMYKYLKPLNRSDFGLYKSVHKEQLWLFGMCIKAKKF